MERDGAFSAALWALSIAKDGLVIRNMERIKKQPRVLRHAPLTNIQKCLLRSFATAHFSFFDYLFLQRIILCAIFLLFIFERVFFCLYVFANLFKWLCN